MASRGFLIRFIDIGLIVLFGFLMISDIEASSRVELADGRSEPGEEVELDEDGRVFVLVEIAANGAYRVSDPGSGAEGEAVWAPDPGALSEELRRRKDLHQVDGAETVVLLQPHPASAVQHTVDAMDVCDRLSLAKSLRMDIDIAPAVEGVERGAPGRGEERGVPEGGTGGVEEGG